MNKRAAWLMVSCLMVAALLLASCGPATEEEEVVIPEEEEKEECNAVIKQFIEAAIAEDFDNASNLWWEGEEGREGIGASIAKNVVYNWRLQDYQDVKVSSIDITRGVVWIYVSGQRQTLEGQGDTAEYSGEIAYTDGSKTQLTAHLLKVEGEWKIHSMGWKPIISD